ncbi:MAG TPA: DMT family transporter [Actinomycetota bacterium]|nr:DMT family transporter [Actinomycetota bacterium]
MSAEPKAEGFTFRDWGLLAGIALMWGSSFVFIDEALETFAPGLIALLRLVLGVATLAWFADARAPVARRDWAPIALLGFLWMAAPFVLFPVAQQWIASSLAGMINGSVPIFAATIAALVARRLPAGRQIFGILLGFAGVLTLSWPAIQGAHSTALGVALVLLASVFYGASINLAVPLQRRYGSLAVLLRVQVCALAFVAVPGLLAVPSSEFAWSSLGALIPLGCLGTAVAFVWMGTFAGRVGAARAALTIYFIPVVAIVLGWLVRGERIAVLSLVGTAMVIGGAALASRHRLEHAESEQPAAERAGAT